MEQRFVKSLLDPSSYQEPTGSVHLLQTHVSYLFITDHFVYKIKKPVDFGFLNFTTLDRRRFYCNEEVRLNSLLCPDIDLGVVELRETTAGGAAFAGNGKVIDYAVMMKRLPAERMLDRLLAEGAVTEADMGRLARTIAGFHLTAERSEEIDKYGSPDSIRRNWEENFQQTAGFAGVTITGRDLQLVREWADGFMSGNAELFAERVSGGFIRDCDGDIHLENICLTDQQVCIFDCIEFNNRFRYSDTAADIAFLLMDLDYHGQSRLADVFLAEYIAATGDREVVRLMDFYKVYRAFVRGKVASLCFNDPAIPEPQRHSARESANSYFRLARGYILRSRLSPSLFITCGLMGSGKSSVAAALATDLGMVLTSSDVVRKELTGTPLHLRQRTGYAEGIYSHSTTEGTYRAMLERTEAALLAGHNAIADATFRRKSDREMFRSLAERLGASFYIIHAGCPEKTARQRLDAREKQPREVSDGRWELFHRQKEEFEPPESGEGRVIFVDTSREFADTIDDILKGMELL